MIHMLLKLEYFLLPVSLDNLRTYGILKAVCAAFRCSEQFP